MFGMFLRSTMNDSPCIAYEIMAPNTAMLSSVPPMTAVLFAESPFTANHRIIMVAKPRIVPANSAMCGIFLELVSDMKGR